MVELTGSVKIRHLTPNDSMTELTDLIHAAYLIRASNNLRYWGTHQSVDDTRYRFQSGQGLIAEQDGRIVGTVTVRPPTEDADVPERRNPNTWSICQFAVLPEVQGTGVGRLLHDAALDYAKSQGARTMVLDTAAPATALIDMYIRWGYTIVGEVDLRPLTNYISVVMSRPIPSGFGIGSPREVN